MPDLRTRKRLDKETLIQMEAVNVRKMIRRVPLRIRHQVIVDSSCIPANISYPTDSKLLGTTWKKLTVVLEKIRAAGIAVVIRGKRKTATLIRSFNLQRKKSKQQIAKTNRKLIRIGKKAGESLSASSVFMNHWCGRFSGEKIVEQPGLVQSYRSMWLADRSFKVPDSAMRIFRTRRW